MAALLLEVATREQLGPIVMEPLSLPTAELTVAALIAERVRSQTARLTPAQQESAVRQALDAFARGAFLAIVDERRRTDPDELLIMNENSRVQFWRLMPLVGG
ncbi:MAG: hypothetical protein K0R39_3664 [Symbiobacteriaceae bacterium]|nr:hypothetical protein [Symbiobacteriaceae bacterium]